MPKIQSIIDQLVPMALQVTLNKRHAAAIISGGRVLSKATNDDRTRQKVFRHVHNTSNCCSSHAEMNAIRKARLLLCGKRPRILWN